MSMGKYERFVRRQYGGGSEDSLENTDSIGPTYDGLMPGMRQEVSPTNWQPQQQHQVSFKSSADRVQEMRNEVYQLTAELFPRRKGMQIRNLCWALRWAVKGYEEAKKLGEAVIQAQRTLPTNKKLYLPIQATDVQLLQKTIEDITQTTPEWWIYRTSNNLGRVIENLQTILRYIAG